MVRGIYHERKNLESSTGFKSYDLGRAIAFKAFVFSSVEGVS